MFSSFWFVTWRFLPASCIDSSPGGNDLHLN